ncbi:MAG: response regulator transcription factor [Acidimicrobiales bacterium]|nr:response regulator transcription factor [Acidimicrobiales bacterium]
MAPTTVLLADDDDRFRSLVRSVLEDDGYVVVAESVDAGSTIAAAEAHRPDIVVLDLVMRGAEGLSTVRRLRADDPARPVLVLSSLVDPAVEREAASLGASYLDKTAGLDALEAAIEAAVAPAGSGSSAGP